MEIEITQFQETRSIPRDVICIYHNQLEYKVEYLFSGDQNGQGVVYVIVKDNKWYAAKLVKSQKDYIKQIQSFLYLGEQNLQFVCKLCFHNPAAKIVRQDGTVLFMPLIVTEFCQYGDLLDFIADIKKCEVFLGQPVSFSYKTSIALLEQLLIGLKQIHTKNIIHRDLKIQNILLDENFQIKIADFGSSTLIQNTLGDKEIGTRLMRPPQAFTPTKQGKIYYGPQSDIFCCGLVFFALCFFGFIPFEQIDDKNEPRITQFYKNFFSKKQNNKNLANFWRSVLKSSGKTQISHDVKRFFCKVFRRDIKQRYKLQQILQSNLLKQKSTPEQIKEQLQSYYLKILGQSSKDRRISKIYELKCLLEQKSRQSIQAEEEGKRTIQEQTQFQTLLEYYRNQLSQINLQEDLEFTTDIYDKYGFVSHPAFTFSWLHQYIQTTIIPNFQNLFCSIIEQKLTNYEINFIKQTQSFNIKFQIQSKGFNTYPKQGQDNEQKQKDKQEQGQEQEEGQRGQGQRGQGSREQVDCYCYQLQVNGHLVRRQSDKKYIIQWRSNQFYMHFVSLLKYIKQGMEALLNFEAEAHKI